MNGKRDLKVRDGQRIGTRVKKCVFYRLAVRGCYLKKAGIGNPRDTNWSVLRVPPSIKIEFWQGFCCII